MVPDSVIHVRNNIVSTFFAWVQNNNINRKNSAVKNTLNVLKLIFDVLLYTKCYNIPICKST